MESRPGLLPIAATIKATLEAPWAADAAGRVCPLRFEAGDTLFREGEDPSGIHILQAGQVDLLFSTRNGMAKPLRVAQQGQILGLSCVVNRQSHDCTAIARTVCEVAFIERTDFLRALQERPAVWLSVLRLLCTDINAAYDDMRHMAARDSRHAAG
jgi:CRP-like cAMP-binding protein